jgi:hypothetical protein
MEGRESSVLAGGITIKKTFVTLAFFVLLSCKEDFALQNGHITNSGREGAKKPIPPAGQTETFYEVVTGKKPEAYSGSVAGKMDVTNALIEDHALLDDYSLYPYDDILNPLDLFPVDTSGDWVVCKTEPLLKKHFFCLHISNLPPVYTMTLFDGKESIKVRCERKEVLIEEYLQYHEIEYNDAKNLLDKIGPVYEIWLDNSVRFPKGNVIIEIADMEGNRIYTENLHFNSLAFNLKKIGGRTFFLQYRKGEKHSNRLVVYKWAPEIDDSGVLVYKPVLAFSIPPEIDYWEGVLTVDAESGTENYIIGQMEDSGALTVLDQFNAL